MENLPAALGGILGLVVVVLAIAISIYWLLFPWFVYHKLDAVIKALGKQNELFTEALGAMEDFRPKAPAMQTLPPLPGKERYFIAVDDNIGGPHSIETIESLVERGTIAPQAVYVIREGGTKWRRFDDAFEIEAAKAE